MLMWMKPAFSMTPLSLVYPEARCGMILELES